MCVSKTSSFLVNKMNMCNIDQQVIADKVKKQETCRMMPAAYYCLRDPAVLASGTGPALSMFGSRGMSEQDMLLATSIVANICPPLQTCKTSEDK